MVCNSSATSLSILESMTVFDEISGVHTKNIQVCSVQNCVKCTQVCMFIRQVALINVFDIFDENLHTKPCSFCFYVQRLMHSSNKNIKLLIEYPNHKKLNFYLFLCILQTSPSLSDSLQTSRLQRKNRNQVCKPEHNKNSQVCICNTFHTSSLLIQ